MITYINLGNYGRLGNQMFEIASTIGIAIRNNTSYGFPLWEYSKYFEGRLPRYYLESYRTYIERSPYYEDVILDTKFDWNLQGYFQSWKYFDHCRDLILDIFKFYPSPVNRIAIHVRRGDYVHLQNKHPLLKMEYYQKAMNYFNGEKFTVFSDDVEWCTKHFPRKNITFSTTSGENPIHDFFKMASHKGFIMANSSFSWWAAYLSGNNNVIAPSKYVIGEDRDDRIPPEWMKI